MKLFELSGADEDIRFSPFVIRIKMALKHKEIDFHAVPIKFTDKSPIEPSGSKTVPVIEDNGKWVKESWDIACYLEKQYQKAPSLFGGDIGTAQTKFINAWSDAVLVRGLFPIIVSDIIPHFTDEDRAYFIPLREKLLGMTIAETIGIRDKIIPQFNSSLTPLRVMLKSQNFICGDTPGYADYSVFGPFQWARIASPLKLIKEGDPIYDWQERMLGLFDGFARSAKLGY